MNDRSKGTHNGLVLGIAVGAAVGLLLNRHPFGVLVGAMAGAAIGFVLDRILARRRASG